VIVLDLEDDLVHVCDHDNQHLKQMNNAKYARKIWRPA
jgi:hypothetical protein